MRVRNVFKVRDARPNVTCQPAIGCRVRHPGKAAGRSVTVFAFRVFYFSIQKVFHKDWRIRGGTIGEDLYLGSLFVCPSRVEVSFSSTLEVPSRVEVEHKKAPLEMRYL